MEINIARCTSVLFSFEKKSNSRNKIMEVFENEILQPVMGEFLKLCEVC